VALAKGQEPEDPRSDEKRHPQQLHHAAQQAAATVALRRREGGHRKGRDGLVWRKKTRAGTMSRHHHMSTSVEMQRPA
jgi:hypothetical protein